MAAIAALLSLGLMLLFVAYYFSDIARLRQETLTNSTLDIAQMMSRGENPAGLRIYRDFPSAYGFRVFTTRARIYRRVLASANTGWLTESLGAAGADAEAGTDKDPAAEHKNLEENFSSFDASGSQGGERVYILVHRVVVAGHRYWIEAFMRGDPGWAVGSVIANEVVERVFLPVLFIVPALTLAMFLAIRRALRPLQTLSSEASAIAQAVARGQSPAPLSGEGLVREFADVAAATNAMLARLGHSLASQRQFIADAAHELRTPLAILLLEVAQLPSDARRERLKADLKNLGDLVNELLRFAQAEEMLTEKLEDVDVAAIAQKVSSEAAMAAINRQQLIELNRPADPVVMAGNATLVEIAIRNLVDNALKYSPPQTTITVNVEPGPTVIVDDCGPGVPVSQRATIFQRFWRADPQSGNGAGVGLALVRRIAALHDGRIWFEDRATGGSRFVLSFAGESRGSGIGA
jgi:signal transduction histidine kinase